MRHVWSADAMPLEFRPMTDDDLNLVQAIEMASHEFPWTMGQLQQSLQLHHCEVCLDSSTLAAYAMLMFAADEAHLLNVTVSLTHRRQGIGRAMLLHLQAYARKFGANSMILEVRQSNAPAVALYQEAGFFEIGMRRNYYQTQQGYENARVMRRVFV